MSAIKSRDGNRCRKDEKVNQIDTAVNEDR